jgi:hypothetical protein
MPDQSEAEGVSLQTAGFRVTQLGDARAGAHAERYEAPLSRFHRTRSVGQNLSQLAR